jgi:PAS domain S-box-containing protein
MVTLMKAIKEASPTTETEALLKELGARVQAQTGALVESQRRFRAVLNGISDSLLIVDRSFTIVAANAGAAAVSGISVETLIGRNCYREFFGQKEICEGCPLLQAFAGGGAASAPFSRMNPDGSVGYLEVSGYPLVVGEGRPAEAVEHIRDVTEKVVRTRQLRTSEKLTAVGHLAAGLAHELGNALGIIGGSVQVLLGKEGDCWQEGREYLEAIHRNVAAADRTIRDLLDFARPREPFWKVIDVTKPLDRARLLLKGEFAKRGVEVVTRYAPGPLRIQGDQEQLEHVFLNLLLNAMQAMEAGGTITLTAVSDPPEWVQVDVTDTGRGIPREHLDQIFDPFFTTRGMGTGLGLSIVHRYVDAHHGRLTIESQEGKGTRVTVFLSAMAPELVRDRE